MALILLAEDNEKNRLLVKTILEYHGHTLIEVQNGTEAVDMARLRRPDLILMDIQMPVMDGIAAGKILKADPDTRDIRIIALTSFAMKGDKEKILEAGFDAYLAKPIDTRQLPEIVKRHLKEMK